MYNIGLKLHCKYRERNSASKKAVFKNIKKVLCKVFLRVDIKFILACCIEQDLALKSSVSIQMRKKNREL